jgi:hypothetical protein
VLCCSSYLAWNFCLAADDCVVEFSVTVRILRLVFACSDVFGIQTFGVLGSNS